MVGRILGGRYEIARELGRGGMGVVYEAVQLDLRRRVAVKVLSLVGADVEPPSESALQRFRQEAIAAAAVHHPNVIEVTDFDKGEGAEPPFLVMELLEGSSLATRLRRGRLTPLEASGIAAQMLDGLAAVHAAGIVHRDVKPANVFLIDLPGGHHLVKLLDFGIAKLSEDERGIRTTTGSFLGSLGYVAPEQILGLEVDARTDVHAVSLCLYEMLTGERALRASSGMNLASAVLSVAIPAIERSDVPRELAEVVARGATKEKESRWPSAAAMREALRPWSDPTDAPPPEPTLREPPRPDDARPQQRAFIAAFGATMLIGAAALGLFLLRATHGSSRTAPATAASTSAAPSAPAPPDLSASAIDAEPTSSEESVEAGSEPVQDAASRERPAAEYAPLVFIDHSWSMTNPEAGERWYRQHEAALRRSCRVGPVCMHWLDLKDNGSTFAHTSYVFRNRPSCNGPRRTAVAQCLGAYVAKHPLPPRECPPDTSAVNCIAELSVEFESPPRP